MCLELEEQHVEDGSVMCLEEQRVEERSGQ